VSLDPADPFNPVSILTSFLKGTGAAVFFWFIGYVFGDILFKGIVEEINIAEIDELEGGLLQRVRDTHADKMKSIRESAVQTVPAEKKEKGKGTEGA
jgi:hypothetical protein